MNAKLLLKMILLTVVILLLVIMGMHNRSSVSFSLPPLLPKPVSQPAAIMYVGFFAAGLITGMLLSLGGGGKSSGGSGSAPKPSKSAK